MLPSWAHAYSHRMMKSYQCDSSQTSKVNGDIRRDLNNQLISFQGEVAFTEDDELQYTRAQIACTLWKSRKNSSSIIITFQIELTQYRYENTNEIKFLRNDISVDKTTWFDEVFPKFEYDGKVVRRDMQDERLYNMYNPQSTRAPINLDQIKSLEFYDRENICYILDNCEMGCDITVIFGGDSVQVTDSDWLFQFANFYHTYETEDMRNKEDMREWFNRSDERTKRLILQIPEFKEILEPEPAAPEIVPFDGEEKVGEPNDLEDAIRDHLLAQETDTGLTCIQAEDLGTEREYRLLKSDDSVQLIATDSQGVFIRTSEDQRSAYVSQILDYETDVVDLGYDKKFAVKNANKYKWVVEDANTIVSSRSSCSDYAEYEQADPVEKKKWGFKDDFMPDAHQMHSIKFAGEKILLGHRPGFGKTINSILLAEKMRNSLCTCTEADETCECQLPDIYMLAPDRKLARHWYEEVGRMTDIDRKHYIWSTYKHLEISQAKTDYPEYHHLDPQELVDLKAGGKDKHPDYKPAQKQLRHCMVCDRRYTRTQMVDMFPDRDDVGKVYDTVRHILYGGSNDKTTLEFHWRLAEDKIFFRCDQCGEAKFITGFTADDEGVNHANFSEHEADGGYTIGEYLMRESGVWKKYYDELKNLAGVEDDTKSIREIKDKIREGVEQVPQNLKLSYKFQKGMNWHMYRAPPCILICDEIHKYVKETKSLVMQVLWKYILSCRFTILASATPVESTGSEITQLYLISEMLRTKRNFWMDEPVRYNMKFNGRFLPPWHLLRPLETGEDMYTVASRMKNKFSRFNTVPNVLNAIAALVASNKKTDSQIDKKFDLDYTKLMNLYMGILGTDKALVENEWVTKGETGQDSYKITKAGYKGFVDAALSKLYVLQASKSRGAKEFPDLIPATPTGYIEVPIDLTRALLKDRPPNSELRYLIRKDSVDTFKVEVEGANSLIVKRDGPWVAKDILELEKLILANRITDGLLTISFKDTNEIEPNAALITNYTDSTGVLPYSKIKERGLDDKIKKLPKILEEYNGIEGLKWLYLHPVRQQIGNYKTTNMYENIPYLPDLLSSKVMKIVTTIEEQVAKGKNVMVYHNKVEMLRMCHRALAMRKHLWVNEDIFEAGLPSEIAEEDAENGDYIFNERLKDLAREGAKKRWVKLNSEWIQTQNEAYNYFDPDNMPEASEALDFDLFQKAYDFVKSVAEQSMYPVVYKNFENNFGKNNLIGTIELATDLLEFGFYAQRAIDKTDMATIQEYHDKYKKLIDGCEDMINITVGKVDFKKKMNILEALDIYLELRRDVAPPEVEEWTNIMRDVCAPYYERAMQQVVTKRPEIRLKPNPERFEEVLQLTEEVKKNYKKYKPPDKPITTKDDILKYWRTLNPVPEDKRELYVIEDGEIQKEFVEIKGKTDLRKTEPEPTGRYVFKVSNASLRSAILRKIGDQSSIDENKTDEQIESDIPLDKEIDDTNWPEGLGGDIRKRCIDYFLERNWKGSAALTSSFKKTSRDSLLRNRPFMKYSLPKTEEVTARRQAETKRLKATDKDLLTERFPMPPKPSLFEQIENFMSDNPRMYKHKFFDQPTAEGVLDLPKKYQNTSNLTFEQVELSKKYVKTKLKREVASYKDAMTFCIWTQMYLRYEWVQRVNIRVDKIPVLDKEGKQVTKNGKPKFKSDPKAILGPKLDNTTIRTIEEYEEILLHLDSNPYAEKAKTQAKIYFNENKMEKRREFLDTMKPRITGMSKDNRITFAVVDGQTVPSNKTTRFVQAFSEGYVDCLFVSESGIVGVDYKSCSPSYMICIDPVVSAGKQDQFNGRTVRRKSHRNLPEEMRTVEYVSFVSKGIEVTNTKEDDKEVIDYNLTELGKLINKEPKESERRIRLILRHRKMKRQDWADKERKKSLVELEALKAEVRKDMALMSDDWVFDEKAETNLDSYDKPGIEEILDLEKRIRQLEASDKVRQKYIPFKGTYATFNTELTPELLATEFSTEAELVFELKVEDIKKQLVPNNPDEMGETDLRSLLTVQEIRFSIEDRRDALDTLDIGWNYDEFTTHPGINQLREKLGCDKISYENQRSRDWLWETGVLATAEQLDPCKSFGRGEAVQREPDNKKWSTYFDNYVNLSHVPVYNNYAFLSVEEYHACVANGKDKYDNYYCYACNKTMLVESVRCPHCGFVVKDNGEFLYYHFVKSGTPIQDSTAAALKEPSLNIKAKNKSTYRRIQRDRLEMVLSLNSIEHQVKQYGDTTYKFDSIKDDENNKSYYRRIVRDPLREEEGGDWYKFMTKPDKEVYKNLCDIYANQEPDRFKGTVDESKPVEIQTRSREGKNAPTDGFTPGTPVQYNDSEWTVVGRNADMITIENSDGDREEVDKSELTLEEEAEDSEEDYVPDEEYMSDISIQSEY